MHDKLIFRLELLFICLSSGLLLSPLLKVSFAEFFPGKCTFGFLVFVCY
uniref:Uncharacterized protein n=1 Tax=Anguilla anguilla TaxID=7936 RepID=A0A0E9SK07_ANGAN